MMGHTIEVNIDCGIAMGIYFDYQTGLKYGAADSRGSEGKAVGH